MRVLVTGGAGFIGSHICEGLSEMGYDVYSLDDYSAGYKSNLAELDIYEIDCDVTDFSSLKTMVKYVGKIDAIFHQAASKKNVCDKDPRRDCIVNAVGAYNVAVIAKEIGAKLIHASTGSVYGEAVRTQDEDHPLNPVSYYGISKLAGEKYANLISDAVVLRYFHVYGERQESDPSRGGVVAIWIDKILKRLPITIYGDGSQERSFTYVKDVVAANIAAMNAKGGFYNCASGYRYTISDLVKEFSKNFNFPIDVRYEDWMPGDVKKFYVDNSLISNEMGIFDWTKLEDGLRRTIEGWKSSQ